MYKWQVPIPRGTKQIRVVEIDYDPEIMIITPPEICSEIEFETYIPWKYTRNDVEGTDFRIFADLTKKNSKSIELVPTLLSRSEAT